MTYTEYSLVKDGSRGYNITLPCFSSDNHFSSAALMNRVYNSILGRIYLFAEDFVNAEDRRAKFRCEFAVESDDDTIRVELNILVQSSNRQKFRKTIAHTWRNGRIIERER